jgi:hypothetical protein
MHPQFAMNRREWLGATAAAALGFTVGGCHTERPPAVEGTTDHETSDLRLLPHPQTVVRTSGSLPIGKPHYVTRGNPSPTATLAMDCLNRRLVNQNGSIPMRLGSVEEGYDASWLTPSDNEFLAAPDTSAEACVLTIAPAGITVVGKSKWGMLNGVQTICQLAEGPTCRGRQHLPCLSIRDWPDLKWRCLAPTLAWYSGWNRLEGYDLCNGTEDEWRWLADWSLLHKCNAWAVCMYGYWPFRLPRYPKETLDVDSFFCNPKTGKKEPWRFTHPNIRREFFPEVIRYANERGIHVHAYIGKNSFNGCEFRRATSPTRTPSATRRSGNRGPRRTDSLPSRRPTRIIRRSASTSSIKRGCTAPSPKRSATMRAAAAPCPRSSSSRTSCWPASWPRARRPRTGESIDLPVQLL